MGHSHPSVILLQPGEHPRWIQMLSGGSEAVGIFSKSCAAQFLFILCKSIVFYFVKEFIYFCFLALRKSLGRECLPVLRSTPAKGNSDENSEALQELLSIPTRLNKQGCEQQSLQRFKVGLFLNDCWHNRTTSLNTVFIAIYPFHVLHTGCIKSIQCNTLFVQHIWKVYPKILSGVSGINHRRILNMVQM